MPLPGGVHALSMAPLRARGRGPGGAVYGRGAVAGVVEPLPLDIRRWHAPMRSTRECAVRRVNRAVEIRFGDRGNRRWRSGGRSSRPAAAGPTSRRPWRSCGVGRLPILGRQAPYAEGRGRRRQAVARWNHGARCDPTRERERPQYISMLLSVVRGPAEPVDFAAAGNAATRRDARRVRDASAAGAPSAEAPTRPGPGHSRDRPSTRWRRQFAADSVPHDRAAKPRDVRVGGAVHSPPSRRRSRRSPPRSAGRLSERPCRVDPITSSLPMKEMAAISRGAFRTRVRSRRPARGARRRCGPLPRSVMLPHRRDFGGDTSVGGQVGVGGCPGGRGRGEPAGFRGTFGGDPQATGGAGAPAPEVHLVGDPSGGHRAVQERGDWRPAPSQRSPRRTRRSGVVAERRPGLPHARRGIA